MYISISGKCYANGLKLQKNHTLHMVTATMKPTEIFIQDFVEKKLCQKSLTLRSPVARHSPENKVSCPRRPASSATKLWESHVPNLIDWDSYLILVCCQKNNTFWRQLAIFWHLMSCSLVEGSSFLKTSVKIYQTIRHHIPQDHYNQNHEISQYAMQGTYTKELLW